MSAQWLIADWVSGFGFALGGLFIGARLRILLGKAPAPVTWTEAGWCVVYGAAFAMLCGVVIR